MPQTNRTPLEDKVRTLCDSLSTATNPADELISGLESVLNDYWEATAGSKFILTLSAEGIIGYQRQSGTNTRIPFTFNERLAFLELAKQAQQFQQRSPALDFVSLKILFLSQQLESQQRERLKDYLLNAPQIEPVFRCLFEEPAKRLQPYSKEDRDRAVANWKEVKARSEIFSRDDDRGDSGSVPNAPAGTAEPDHAQGHAAALAKPTNVHYRPRPDDLR